MGKTVCWRLMMSRLMMFISLQGVLSWQKVTSASCFYSSVLHSKTSGLFTWSLTNYDGDSWKIQTPLMTERNLAVFIRTTSGKSAKLFTRNLCHAVRQRPWNLLQSCAISMCFFIIAHVGFMQHTPNKSFLVNIFADFPDVRVKNFRFRPVIAGIWN